MIEDEQVARLILITDDNLVWLHDIPVRYYPISNDVLRTLDSLDAMLTHYAGPGQTIPARLRQALPFDQLLIVVQVVPGPYLNALCTTLKEKAAEFGDSVYANRLILAYYRGRLPDADAYLFHLVYSYISACRYTETKLNMRVRSTKRLSEEREAVWRKRAVRRSPAVRTRKKLILPRQHYGDIHLELINNKRRLLQEARKMKNCVDAYAFDIAEGQCAIYHVRYQGGDYTMEVQENERGRLRVNQLLGPQNSPAPKDLQIRMRSLLNRKADAG